VRSSIGTIALLVATIAAATGAQAFDAAKYPNWSGQWKRPPGVGNQWDTSKPARRGQQPPLTPEYQAIYEANLADQAAGGQGTDPTFTCIPDGMPRAMNVIFPMEIVIQPHITHMMIEYLSMLRRVYTDGRDWPENAEASFMGYSIGKWADEDGDGRYDTLLIETRNLKGPRAFDASGIPLHEDNQTIVKERIYLDKADKNVMHDEVTTFDHALTRPWTVMKNYHRDVISRADWTDEYCESNHHVTLGNDDYMLSADGFLMPTRKDQPAPNLKYFGRK
jgi:hypothetical protein